MKTETEKIQIDRTTYICETCGHKSLDRWSMEHHEKTHKQTNCKHVSCEYEIDEYRDIRRTCKNCGTIDKVELDIYDGELMSKVFNMLKGT